MGGGEREEAKGMKGRGENEELTERCKRKGCREGKEKGRRTG